MLHPEKNRALSVQECAGHKDSVTHIAAVEPFLINCATLVLCMLFDFLGVSAFDIILFIVA